MNDEIYYPHYIPVVVLHGDHCISLLLIATPTLTRFLWSLNADDTLISTWIFVVILQHGCYVLVGCFRDSNLLVTVLFVTPMCHTFCTRLVSLNSASLRLFLMLPWEGGFRSVIKVPAQRFNKHLMGKTK